MTKPINFIPAILLAAFVYSQNAHAQLTNPLALKIFIDNKGNGAVVNLTCTNFAKDKLVDTKFWTSISTGVYQYKTLVSDKELTILTDQLHNKAISLGCGSLGASGIASGSLSASTQGDNSNSATAPNTNSSITKENSTKTNPDGSVYTYVKRSGPVCKVQSDGTAKCSNGEILAATTKSAGVILPKMETTMTGPDGSTINTTTDPNTGIKKTEVWSKSVAESEDGNEVSKLQDVTITDTETGQSISGKSESELLEAVKDLKPEEAKAKFLEAIKGKGQAQALDGEAQKEQSELDAKSAAFKQNAQIFIQNLSARISTICLDTTKQVPTVDANCVQEVRDAIYNGSGEQIPEVTGAPAAENEGLLDKKGLINLLNRFEKSYASCAKNSPLADKVCSAVRNETTRSVSQGLTVVSSMLQSLGGAEMCKVTSKSSMIGQSIFLAAGVACETTRILCVSTCGAGTKSLTKMAKRLDSIAKVSKDKTIIVDLNNFKAQLTQTASNLIAPEVAECKKHAASTKDLVTTATGLASAFMQAKDCNNKLSALAASSALSSVSGATSCNDPASSIYSSQTCVCQRDNTAYGCAGYAGSINGGAVGKIGSSAGVSQMAGGTTGSNGLNTSALAGTHGLGDSGNGWNGIGGNPSAEANQDLSFGKAGSASVGGGGGGSGGSAGAAEGLTDEHPAADSLAGKYGNGFSGFGGRGAGAAGKAIQNQKYSEAQLAAAKRKLASDQAKNEISSASGFSNWDKVKTRYLENKSTLMGN